MNIMSGTNMMKLRPMPLNLLQKWTYVSCKSKLSLLIIPTLLMYWLLPKQISILLGNRCKLPVYTVTVFLKVIGPQGPLCIWKPDYAPRDALSCVMQLLCWFTAHLGWIDYKGRSLAWTKLPSANLHFQDSIVRQLP